MYPFRYGSSCMLGFFPFADVIFSILISILCFCTDGRIPEEISTYFSLHRTPVFV